MTLQLHLYKQKLFPIRDISVAARYAHCRDNIYRDSLAQWLFRLYKLYSPWASLLGYTNLQNLTACSHDEKSPAG